MKVLVTGASGFVGRAIVEQFTTRYGHQVRAVSRDALLAMPAGVETVTVPSYDADTDWRHALAGCDAVIHAAARVHVMRDDARDPLHAYRATNVGGTVQLAQQAKAAGVQRFVFISSIKVNGEVTQPGAPFTADAVPNPSDPYGISKWEAEQALRTLGDGETFRTVVVRPVLVYGPGVKANFKAMMQWLVQGIPLPLAHTTNRRSLVALDTLVSVLERAMVHPLPRHATFLVSDDHDLSTAELLRRTAQALGTTARLFPVPTGLLTMAAAAVGRRDAVQRLVSSLQVDITATRRELQWSPPLTVTAALEQTARDFLARRSA
jgi:nucleoside-diphosphate-sugar epimerase